MSIDGESRDAVTSATSTIWDNHVRKDGTPEGFTIRTTYPTNPNGVQVMLETAKKMAAMLKPAGYEFSIEETHHVTKLDSPSGTALTLAAVVKSVTGVEPPIKAHRAGDAAGLHVLEAKSTADRLLLTHEAHSRRGFAEGAVRAAEWLSTRRGCFDFQEIYTQV